RPSRAGPRAALTSPMSRRAALVVAVIATLGLLVSAVALWPRDDGTPAVDPGSAAGPLAAPDLAGESPRRPTTPGERVPRSPATLPAPAPEPARAVQLTAPTVGLDLPVRPVGVARDRQMALPADPSVLGWYRHGPAPGAGRGSVVVAGHLDSRRFGLGPLVRLRDVQVGDRVVVTRDDGTRRAYVVRSLRRYDRQALPAELFSRAGAERLRIVTCGGAFLPDRGGYQQNLVVTAVPGQVAAG
ncbi:MAG TPA: class F sortase, partial [Nocardioides sp.]|nr:class F sortase [Nocardioides sp.]